jgi:hypothetical protein
MKNLGEEQFGKFSSLPTDTFASLSMTIWRTRPFTLFRVVTTGIVLTAERLSVKTFDNAL